MHPSQIQERLAEIRTERNRLSTEAANLDARSFDAPEERRAGYEERRERLNTGIANLDEEAGELRAEIADQDERRSALQQGLRNGTLRTESGDGASAMPAEPARGDRRFDGALRTIERHADLMTDPALIESAIRTDQTGLGASYLEAVGDEHYREAFRMILANPTTAQLQMTPEQAESVRRVNQASEARAMVEGTGSAGGFGVPFALDPTILLSSAGALNPIRQLASQITVATSLWKGVSSTGVTGGYAAESAEATDGSPTLVQPEIAVERCHVFVPYSYEVGQDYVGLESELAKLIVDKKNEIEAVKFLEGAGHGSHEPTGLLTGLESAQVVKTVGAKALAVGDIYKLKAALPARWLGDGAWAAAPPVLDTIFKFVGTGSTEPQIMPTRDAGMFGKATAEWSTMSTATTTTGSKVLLYGDFDEFRIVDRIGMSVELIPNLFGTNGRPTGQRGLYAFWRNGSGVLVPNAFRALEVA